MYELRCPSCHHVVKSAFVRLGAATACSSCGQRYRVDAQHLTRKSAGRPVSMEPGTARSGSPGLGSDNPAGDGETVVGLSGLSELMRSHGTAAVNVGSGSPRPTATGIVNPAQPDSLPEAHAVNADSPSGSRTRRRARQSRLKRKRHSLYLFVGSVVLAVAAIGTIVFIATRDSGEATQRSRSSERDKDNDDSTLERAGITDAIDEVLELKEDDGQQPSTQPSDGTDAGDDVGPTDPDSSTDPPATSPGSDSLSGVGVDGSTDTPRDGSGAGEVPQTSDSPGTSETGSAASDDEVTVIERLRQRWGLTGDASEDDESRTDDPPATSDPLSGDNPAPPDEPD